MQKEPSLLLLPTVVAKIQSEERGLPKKREVFPTICKKIGLGEFFAQMFEEKGAEEEFYFSFTF